MVMPGADKNEPENIPTKINTSITFWQIYRLNETISIHSFYVTPSYLLLVGKCHEITTITFPILIHFPNGRKFI